MIPFILLIVVSVLPTAFWFWFLFGKGGIKVISFGTMFKVFIFGVIAAFLALVAETLLYKFLIVGYFEFWIGKEFSMIAIKEISMIMVLTFIFIAPIEELAKYFFLKREIYRNQDVDEILKGVQAGIILGLGFVGVENFFYFSQGPVNLTSLFPLVLLRFFLSSLAHAIYSGVMGYYLALAKFHKLYQKFFLKTGLLSVILLHGFFNFSIMTQVFYYTLGFLLAAFIILIKWMVDRRDFATFLIKGQSPVFAPLFAKKQEIDTFLSKKNYTFSEIKSLLFCPRCLAMRKMGQDLCPSCGFKFDQ